MNQTKVRLEVILHLSQLDKVSAPVNRTNLLDRYQWVVLTHLYHMIPQPNLDKIAKDLLSASRETAKSLGAQDLVILRLMLPKSKVVHIYQKEMTTMRRISVSTSPLLKRLKRQWMSTASLDSTERNLLTSPQTRIGSVIPKISISNAQDLP